MRFWEVQIFVRPFFNFSKSYKTGAFCWSVCLCVSLNLLSLKKCEKFKHKRNNLKNISTNYARETCSRNFFLEPKTLQNFHAEFNTAFVAKLEPKRVLIKNIHLFVCDASFWRVVYKKEKMLNI